MLTGGLIYAAGVIGMSMVTSPWLLYLTGGVMVGLGIALTIDMPKRSGAQDITDWIRSRPGVMFVDVICVHFEETDDAADPTSDGSFDHHEMPQQRTTG